MANTLRTLGACLAVIGIGLAHVADAQAHAACPADRVPTEDGCVQLTGSIVDPDLGPDYAIIRLPEGVDPEVTRALRDQGYYASNDDQCECLYKVVDAGQPRAI